MIKGKDQQGSKRKEKIKGYINQIFALNSLKPQQITIKGRFPPNDSRKTRSKEQDRE